MDEMDYELLKRRHRTLMRQAQQVIDEARRIRYDFRRSFKTVDAWGLRPARSDKAAAKPSGMTTSAPPVADGDTED
ncbi:hypothetical protein J2847_002682 [Azospirillum agricola]|uniref:hypothetical protein n=1 Tax=Azospirillum agricola TaxID=1720247 RepID=UPI001AEA1FB7|nr:hypothetical protein [Azospirillum agricola]MBP2229383.1 hypothetical protein [Azospirillum agricola]